MTSAVDRSILVSMRIYRAVLERWPRGNYIAYVPELTGCVSEGVDLPDAIRNLREAVELYLEDCTAGGSRPTSDYILEWEEIENPDPLQGFAMNHPSPELRYVLERAGYECRSEKGNHLLMRNAAGARLILVKRFDRETIDRLWGSLSTVEQEKIVEQLLAELPPSQRTRYERAREIGGYEFAKSRQELIDSYVQRAWKDLRMTQ